MLATPAAVAYAEALPAAGVRRPEPGPEEPCPVRTRRPPCAPLRPAPAPAPPCCAGSGFVLVAAVCLAPLWGVLALSWSVLAVAFLFVADGAADGFFVWRRAREARGDARADDPVLVSEFLKTYFVVVAAMLMIPYMAFSGRLLKPGGEAPRTCTAPSRSGSSGRC